MKTLSRWANQHRWKAILLLLLGDLLLGLLGISAGICLNGHQLGFSKMVVVLIVWASLTVIYLFPRQGGNDSENQKYTMRSICHLLIYCFAFLLFVAAGNHVPQLLSKYEAEIRAIPLYIKFNDEKPDQHLRYQQHYVNTSPGSSSKLLRASGIKNYLRVAVCTLEAHNEDLPKDFVLFLLVLGGISAAGLACLLAALSNSVSCSGIQLVASSFAMLATGNLVGAVVPVLMIVLKLAGP